jgi:hypothetical protein
MDESRQGPLMRVMGHEPEISVWEQEAELAAGLSVLVREQALTLPASSELRVRLLRGADGLQGLAAGRGLTPGRPKLAQSG